MKNFSVILCLWSLVFFGSFLFATEDIVNVTDDFRGQTITLQPHQLLKVSLKCQSGPGTGYGWLPVSLQREGILRQVEREVYDPDSQLAGAGATYRCLFAGLKEGRGELHFIFARSWDVENTKLADFTVKVNCRGAYNGSYQPAVEKPFIPETIEQVRALPTHYNACEPNGCTPVKNQGQCGSCWDFATTAAVEETIRLKTGITKDLSEQWVLSCNSSGSSCSGGYSIFSMYKSPGAVYEYDFPYTATNGTCGSSYNYHDKIAATGSAGTTTAAIKQSIYDYGPVYVTVCADNPFMAYSSGVYTGPSCFSNNHAVCLTGWDDTTSTGYWYMKNSWGPAWGEAGYMRIGYGVCNIGASAAYGSYSTTSGGAVSHFDYTINDSTATFLNQANCGGCTFTSQTWTFGDGATSTVAAPSHAYASGGTYTVKLAVVASGSSDDATFPVYIPYALTDSTPINNITVPAKGWTMYKFQVPAGARDMRFVTSGGTGGNVNMFVRFGDTPREFNYDLLAATAGSSEETIIIPAPSAGFYYVGLNSADTQVTGLSIEASCNKPAAEFSVTRYMKIAYFTDVSVDSDDGITSWNWDFGDGSTSVQKSPSHEYADGSYAVILTARNSKNETSVRTRHFSLPQVTCAQKSTSASAEWIKEVKIATFTNASAGSTYSDFSAKIINVEAGKTYSFTLTPGFSSSAQSEFWKIWVDYNRSNTPSDSPLVPELLYASTTGSTSAVSGTFTVPAGYALPGQARLRVAMCRGSAPTACTNFTNGEVEDYTINVVTAQPPVADYSYTVTGLSVQFNDISTDPDGTISSRSWTFGDGGTSIATSPSHVFAAAGTYTVCLTVTDNSSLQDTECKNISVTNPTTTKECFVGSFANAGVWVYDFNTSTWAQWNTYDASILAIGDVNGNGIEDLVGVYGAMGIWIRYDNGIWAKVNVSGNPASMAIGDVDGNGTGELIGVWPGIGDWAYNVSGNSWTKILAKDANQVSTGDYDLDGKAEVLGWWSPEGLYVYNVDTAVWAKILDETGLLQIGTGDMNGDKRADVLGIWTHGTWYYNPATGVWAKLHDPAEKIAAADLNGGGSDDLIGSWAGVAGIWVRYSETGTWAKIHDAKPACFAGGKLK